MKLIVGLGNPDSKYEGTRHNIGRMIVEFIARTEGLSFSKKRLEKAYGAKWECEGVPLFLAYPDNYMNVSGESVAALVRSLNVESSKDLLVLVDDYALPFGNLRLRGKGSDGGHNGLKSIDRMLGTSDYARLRIGIRSLEDFRANDNKNQQSGNFSLEDFVLSKFSKEEKASLPLIFERGYEACSSWSTCALEQAMNQVNRRDVGL